MPFSILHLRPSPLESVPPKKMSQRTCGPRESAGLGVSWVSFQGNLCSLSKAAVHKEPAETLCAQDSVTGSPTLSPGPPTTVSQSFILQLSVECPVSGTHIMLTGTQRSALQTFACFRKNWGGGWPLQLIKTESQERCGLLYQVTKRVKCQTCLMKQRKY